MPRSLTNALKKVHSLSTQSSILSTPPSSVYPSIIEEIVNWYKKNHEIFPWRAQNLPYGVWVSEVMLQQTTVRTVIPYFQKFMERFPSVAYLAQAHIDEVLTYWQGLGYYRRAHQLHKAAQVIVSNYNGIFPTEFSEIRSLPGIGDYTASAILSIALLQPFVPVDGNVCRVFSRLFALENTAKDLPKILKPYIKECESALLEYNLNPSFFAQGLMDLGREVCTPKNPRCDLCPVSNVCEAKAKNIQDTLPLKDKKQSIPTKYANCWIHIKDNQILLQKRPQKGLLSGLWQFPMTEFSLSKETQKSDKIIGSVQHVFSHFKLIVDIYEGGESIFPDGTWVEMKDIEHYALPTLMHKILKVFSAF